MVWTRNYFKFKAGEWNNLADLTTGGKKCFAYQQREMWNFLYGHASEEFAELTPEDVAV